MITDGESHDSPDLQKAVEDSEKDNITLYAIAVSITLYAIAVSIANIVESVLWPSDALSESVLWLSGAGLLQPPRHQPRGLPQRDQVHCHRPRRTLLQRDGRVGPQRHRRRPGREDLQSRGCVCVCPLLVVRR